MVHVFNQTPLSAAPLPVDLSRKEPFLKPSQKQLPQPTLPPISRYGKIKSFITQPSVIALKAASLITVLAVSAFAAKECLFSKPSMGVARAPPPANVSQSLLVPPISKDFSPAMQCYPLPSFKAQLLIAPPPSKVNEIQFSLDAPLDTQLSTNETSKSPYIQIYAGKSTQSEIPVLQKNNASASQNLELIGLICCDEMPLFLNQTNPVNESHPSIPSPALETLKLMSYKAVELGEKIISSTASTLGDVALLGGKAVYYGTPYLARGTISVLGTAITAIGSAVSTGAAVLGFYTVVYASTHKLARPPFSDDLDWLVCKISDLALVKITHLAKRALNRQ